MAINFPSNPSLNQTYSAGDRTWFWNGTYWQQQSTTIGYSGSQGFTGSRGAATVMKGSVATEQDLPIPYGGDIGDGYLVESTGFVWLWDGSSWDVFGRFTGYTGSRGLGILDVDIINDDLIITYSDSTQENLGRIIGYDGSVGFTGSRGEAGTSFVIKGSVATPQDLPDPYVGDIGDGYIVQSTGDLYIWDGDEWVNAGQIVGPQGYTGSRGADGIIGVDGFTGSQGDQGYTGSKGDPGNFGGVTFDYTFLANTDSSLAPGDGNLKFNDLNMFSATELYIGDTDDNSVNLDNYLATIDASTSELKGHFRISKKGRPEDFVIFAITGVSINAGEYFVVPCTFLSGQLTDSSTTFEQGDDILITFARTGDKGDTGFVGSRGDIGFTGSQGAPGTSFTIKGSVPTPQDLVTPYLGDIGDGYIVESTGDLYVWDGGQWFNAGQIVGPQGYAGSQGDQGYTGSQGDQGYTGSQGESTFTWGPTAPLNPAIGDRWYDTKRGFLVVYVDDGDSQQWVEVSASGFMGQQGYTGSAGNLSAEISAADEGRALVTNGTTADWAGGSLGYRNKIINGSFEIWQRGTSIASANAYRADRWIVGSSGSITVSRQTFAVGFTEIPGSPRYYCRLAHTTALTGTSLSQRIEYPAYFANKTYTVTFWARSSGTGIALSYVLLRFTNDAAYDNIININKELTSSWEKIQVTITCSAFPTTLSDATDYMNLIIRIANNHNGNVDIAQVQVEEGTIGTVFEQRPISLETAMCYRYYFNMSSTATYGAFANGAGFVNISDFVVRTPIPMRENVSVSLTARSTFYVDPGNPGTTLSAIDATPYGITIRLNAGTEGRAYKLRANNNASAAITFDAEL